MINGEVANELKGRREGELALLIRYKASTHAGSFANNTNDAVPDSATTSDSAFQTFGDLCLRYKLL